MFLFDVKLLEDYLKKIETYRSVNELYAKVQFNTVACVGITYCIICSLILDMNNIKINKSKFINPCSRHPR
jgi:hypothetical protein